MNLHLSLNRFASAEAAVMADLSHDTIRTWRKRGLLPEDKHWNGSYDSLQVCALAIRRTMLLQGASPKETAPIGRRAAPAVLFAAVLSSGHSQEASGIREAARDLYGSTELSARLTESYTEQGNVFEFIRSWLGGPAETSANYLVAIDDGDYEPVFSSLLAVSRQDAISLRCIDLKALGGEVASRAPKPLLFAKRE